MSEDKKQLLSTLIQIGKVDSALARITAERKRFDTSVKDKVAAIKKAESEIAGKSKIILEKKTFFQKEEKAIKEEREALVSRRRSLATISNYKVQQAAQREVEHTGRQIDAREEPMLLLLEETERLQADETKFKANLSKLKDELVALQKEGEASQGPLDAREAQHAQEREELVGKVDRPTLQLYERVKEKFPLDSVVSVKNNICSGCYMQVGPQIMVQISRGDAIVRCLGCGRILFIEANTEQATSS